MNNNTPPRWKYFCNLSTGDKFRGPISTGSGIHSGEKMWIIYEKAGVAAGKVIEQHGYGNTRMVGGLIRFGPWEKCWMNLDVSAESDAKTKGVK